MARSPSSKQNMTDRSRSISRAVANSVGGVSSHDHQKTSRPGAITKMSSIVSGITHLFTSIFEIIGGIFSTIANIAATAVNTVISAIQNLLALVVNLLNSVIDLFGGLVGFLIGNIFTIALIGGAYFAYVKYQQSQGRTVGIKKRQ